MPKLGLSFFVKGFLYFLKLFVEGFLSFLLRPFLRDSYPFLKPFQRENDRNMYGIVAFLFVRDPFRKPFFK